MNNQELLLAQNMIDQMEIGEKKCLKEIYGENWDKISKPTNFGKQFKQAVKDTSLTNIKYIGIRITGRCDEYERI